MHDLRKNNKGFTLVELIIVVAILAVLMAMLAPQYIRYVQRSRETTDAFSMGEIARAAMVAYTADDSPGYTETTVIVDTTGDLTYTSTGDLTDAVKELVPEGSYTFRSNLYREEASITITITDDGQAQWTEPSA